MKSASRMFKMLLGGGLVVLLAVITGCGNVAAQTSLPVSLGLRLWLRSDLGTTVDDSGKVLTWADQSGNGNDFTQNIANARPTLSAGFGPGGTSVLHFDGVDDVLQNSAQIVIGTSVTVFTVMAVREPGYPWTLGTSIASGRLFYEGHPDGGVTGPDYFDVAHDYGYDARASFPGINDDQYKVLTITGSDKIHNIRVFVNGTPAVMTASGINRDLNFSPGNTLGFVHTTPREFTEVDFTEFIVYDRELNQTERESVEAYLMSRYFTQVLDVEVDIKPGSDPNNLNPKSKGVIPVAILTTATFDATTVDPLSVRFGPSGATEAHYQGHIEDVDGDGDQDLVLHFRTQDTGIQCRDTSASLTGETFAGQVIVGSDSLDTVGCK